jgi:fructose-1,6-bisphosphatase I
MTTLPDYLERWAKADMLRVDVAAAVEAIAGASFAVADLVARAPLISARGAGGVNSAGDAQTVVDVVADRLFLDALRTVRVAAVASEEQAEPVALRADSTIAVTLDPLDGSSNLETNLSVGTIFGIMPTAGADTTDAIFRQPGDRQLAAGFVVYGPQTSLVLSLRDGVDIFVRDRRAGFVLARRNALIPSGKREYAINGSNRRHWNEPVRQYIDDCVAGKEGPRGADFNTRWIASLVAEAYRILARGGIFLYPADARAGYQNGRLRLVYEANPIALLVEQAAGAATDGRRRILDVEPGSVHERVPLVFGAADEVERLAAYHSDRLALGERSPLFGRRGLFRA